MASVIRLARYRSVAHRDIPLEIPAGDSDLRPIAVMLWTVSAVRVALTLLHQEAFGVESSLALVCALLLPFAVIHARHARDTAPQ
jgi:hypothetical protein